MLKTFLTSSSLFFANVRNIRSHFILGLVVVATLSSVDAANITISPSSDSFTLGKTFSVDVLLTNNQDTINGVSAALTFPADELQVVSLSKSGSVLGLWAEEPSFSNTNGSVSLEGVSLNPGFSGTSGKVITITFKAVGVGKAVVALKSGSVLANDGNATNVLGTLGSATFSLTEQGERTPLPTLDTNTGVSAQKALTITSSSYPDSDAWYSSKDATFAWSIGSDVSAVRTLYNDFPSSSPNRLFDPAIASRSFTVDTDGVMYLHIQAKQGGTWGPVAHYKFQVDSHAPENLKASLTDATTSSNPSPTVLITGTDTLSGLDHITMSVDKGDIVVFPITESNLYHIPKQGAGKHTVLITLYDKAGNNSQISLDYTTQTIAVPIITSYSRRVEVGGPVEIDGSGYPNTTVEVLLTNSDNKIFSEKTTTDDHGNFKLVWSKNLSSGVYEMQARTLDAQGGMSELSETHVITLEQVALIRIGMFIMNWLSLALMAILAITLVAATFWYAFLEFSRFRRKIRRTLSDVENTLKTNVQALRRDTEEFHTILLKAEKKRELTKEEQAILKKFKKRLEITESEIEKKLEQIG